MSVHSTGPYIGMRKPLNGCMCQDGSCKSCNRVVEAFEAIREALRAFVDCAPDPPIRLMADAHNALALADEVKP